MSTLADTILDGMAKRKNNSYEKKGCYKGGIEYNGEWFPTKKALWEKYGNVKFNTFKTRLHRGYTLEQALGQHIGRDADMAKDNS